MRDLRPARIASRYIAAPTAVPESSGQLDRNDSRNGVSSPILPLKTLFMKQPPDRATRSSAGLLVERDEDPGHRPFEDLLRRRGEPFVLGSEVVAGPAGRPERPHELVGEHAPVELVVELEVLERELERAVALDADEVRERREELVVRIGVRRERHHLPLVGVGPEPEELRDRAVEEADRVRVPHLAAAS